MKDQDKTKVELVGELIEIRQENDDLEVSLVTLKQREDAATEAGAISKPEDAMWNTGVWYKSLYSMMRLMCDTVPDLIWAKDMDGKFLFVNRAMCENLLSARDTEEPIGKTDMFFADRERSAHPENTDWHTFGEICVNSDELVKSSKRPGRFYEFGNVKGEFLHLDVHKAPLWNEHGEMMGTVGCGRIVTEEKRLQEALGRKSDEQSLLLDNIGTQIWFLTDSDTCGGVNKARAEFLGKPPEWLENKSLYEILTKEEADICVAGNIDVFKTKKPVRSEEWLKNGAGQLRLLAITKTPKLDETGNVEYVICSAEDITNRKKAENALRESEERFRAILEGAADCIWVKDRSLKYTHVNSAMCKLMGLPSSQILGRQAKDFYDEETARQLDALDARVLKGESIEFEQARNVRGTMMMFHDTRMPLRDQAVDIIGLCVISRNITERKEATAPSPPNERDYQAPATRAVLKRARLAAASDCILLLQGESGSGKDFLARWIHEHLRRSNGPYFAINCAAVPALLAESELFGHERGSFTGALATKKGLLELAEGGTILLNEVGELPVSLQAKLLTFLDTRSFVRLGGQRHIQVNARLIAATHRDLRLEVEEKRFLKPLFYRLNVLPIHVPPLRDRAEDTSLFLWRRSCRNWLPNCSLPQCQSYTRV